METHTGYSMKNRTRFKLREGACLLIRCASSRLLEGSRVDISLVVLQEFDALKEPHIVFLELGCFAV